MFAATHGGRPYSQLDRFLGDATVTLVDICTPSGAHLEPAVAAAAAGKHLVVEKPLEITTERCDRIIAACGEAGVLCSGIFQSRFSRGAAAMKKLVDGGAFGTVVVAGASTRYFRTDEYYAASDWHGTWEVDGGGALMNQSIHAVDLLNWLVGPVTSVSAHTATVAHQGIEVEDVATASLQFANGALGTIVGSTGAFPGFDKQIEIAGTRGSATMVQNRIVEWHFQDERWNDVAAEGAEEDTGSSGAADPRAVAPVLHRRQLEDVAAAIENERPPSVTASGARDAVAIVRAVYDSARTGGRVAVSMG